MSVRVAYDPSQGVACLYCSTSMTAFGPVFADGGALAQAWDFLDWLAGPGADYADRTGINHKDGDPRTFTPRGLARMRARWENERVAEGEHQDEARARDF